LPTFAARLLEAEADRIESPDRPQSKSYQSTLDLFAQWAKEEAAMDPSEIQRGEQELQDLMDGMNRARLECEGPDARKIFP